VSTEYPSGTTSGITMTASAVPTKSAAHSEMAGSENASVGTFGPTEVATETSITGKSAARSTASTAAKKLSIGPGGLIGVSSVVSSATVDVTAATSGTIAKPSGGTTVQGMTVAGVPVTVDEHGVHAQGHGAALTAANAQVNKALAQTQTQIFLTQPTTTTSPSGTTYDAGALFISLGDGNVFIRVGGAVAIAGASNVTPYTPPTGQEAPFALPPPVGAVTTPTGPTLSTNTGPSLPNTGPAPQTAPNDQPNGLSFLPTSAHFPGGALAPGWLVAALVGAALVAFGLWRLPDRLLEQTPTACPLGENT
jgi:hypothetical protein